MAEQSKKLSTGLLVLGGLGLGLGAFALGRRIGHESAEGELFDLLGDVLTDVEERQIDVARKQDELAMHTSGLSERLRELSEQMRGKA